MRRFAFDIGTNSIGWCVLDPKNKRIVDTGVRLFSDGRDPKSKQSLAADRRAARMMRRQRDRRLDRNARLMEVLVRHGLMPTDPGERKALEAEDPYDLRTRALDEALPPHHLGRALFHLAQRRGFKSNRKTDSDDETGVVKEGIAELERRMGQAGARTLGEYLHRRMKRRKSVRRTYLDRSLIKDEFEKIWSKQSALNQGLDQAARSDIENVMFFQRNLLAPEPGFCELDPTQKRAPKATVCFQQFRILQDLGNLRLVMPDRTERRLTMEERDALRVLLSVQNSATWSKMRKAIKADRFSRFNFEERDQKRKGLDGDRVSAPLSAALGKKWAALSLEEKDRVVLAMDAADTDERFDSFCEAESFTPEQAETLRGVKLPTGYGRLGVATLRKLVQIMEDQGLDYASACTEAGYHHSDQRPETLRDQLPYYGELVRSTVGDTANPDDAPEQRYGKVTNPTVHAGLNQLVKLTNGLIARHGRPDEVVLEIARDLKLSRKQKDEIKKRQKRETEANERIDGVLDEYKVERSRLNRQKMKLWEELTEGAIGRLCPFSGLPIGLSQLLSNAVETEHILPFSRSLDDSMANKTVAFVTANRDKGNRSPYDAFAHSPGEYRWEEILERAQRLPRNKAWRFAPNAMERLEHDGDFLARHLNDTRYLSRVAREIMSYVCRDVWVVPGQMTAILRGRWGLGSILPTSNLDPEYGPDSSVKKNRLDHRHHAIDAIVVGLTDRGLLGRIARANAREGMDALEISDPDGWDDFRGHVREAILAINVSHKSDRRLSGGRIQRGNSGSTSGKLHNATAYGLASAPDPSGYVVVVSRKSFDELEEGDIPKIRDKALRDALEVYVDGRRTDGKIGKKDFAAARESFAKRGWPIGRGRLRGVRLVERMKQDALIQIADPRSAKVYKAYKGDSNAYMDLLRLPNGRWTGCIFSTFEANHHEGGQPRWKADYPAAKRIARLFNEDMARVSHNGEERLVTIVKMSGQTIVMSDHTAAGPLKARDATRDDPYKYISMAASKLREARFRQVKVTVDGRVIDPGPLSARF